MLIAWGVDIERFFDEIENSIYETFYRPNMEKAVFLSNYAMVSNHKNYQEK